MTNIVQNNSILLPPFLNISNLPELSYAKECFKVRHWFFKKLLPFHVFFLIIFLKHAASFLDGCF